MSDVIIDTFKMIKDPPSRDSKVQIDSRAQLDKKGLPQSGSPMSDVIIDTFKMVKDPPKKSSEA